MITGCLIVVCLIVGILIPDIELVLGLVGSTMGSSICVIFPGMMFLKLTNKDTTERLAARAVVVIGKEVIIYKKQFIVQFPRTNHLDSWNLCQPSRCCWRVR